MIETSWQFKMNHGVEAILLTFSEERKMVRLSGVLKTRDKIIVSNEEGKLVLVGIIEIF